MRITIEADNQTVLSAPVHDAARTTDAIDGGSPSKTLLQAVAESLSISPSLSPSTEREGINGGSPPEWLLKAIKGAAADTTDSVIDNTATNAGSAPSSL